MTFFLLVVIKLSVTCRVCAGPKRFSHDSQRQKRKVLSHLLCSVAMATTK